MTVEVPRLVKAGTVRGTVTCRRDSFTTPVSAALAIKVAKKKR